MKQFLKWRYGVALVGLTAFVVACSEATNNPVAPDGPSAGSVKRITQQGDLGQCMGDDAVDNFANVDGINANSDPTDFNCTANDVRIANARTATGTPIACVQGQQFQVDIVADVVETSTSPRYDIGIWVAQGGTTTALTGSCAFFYLPNGSGAPVENLDSDQCGDLQNAATVTGFSLSQLTLTCNDPNNDGFLEVQSCVSWTEPGADRVCSDASAAQTRAGTLPGNKSKCNCEPFLVPIRIQGSLTVVKQVVNDNGGTAGVNAFGLSTDAGSLVFDAGTGTTTKTYTATAIPVDSGAYTLRENDIAGYTEGTWSCTGGNLTNNTISAGSVTIGWNQNVTCTIVNNDQAAHLIIIKHVINDNGGTAVASAFTNTIGGVTAVGGNAVTGAESPGVDKTLSSVGAYTVTEGTHTGYTVSYSTDCNGTIALGETKTCTVTNNDNAASLTIIKVVVNDNGGTAAAGDFSMTIGGVTADGGQTVTGTVSPGVTKNLTTVGAYTVTEGTHTGYDVSYSADCNSTIALGQSKTCTVTNNDQAAHLIVIKHVINDNGGTAAASAFTNTIGGVTAVGGNAVTGAESPGVDKTLSTVGAYTVTEGTHTGYDVSYSADCNSTIALGQTKTCTVTNNDQPAKLVVRKIVIGAGSTFGFTGTGGGVDASFNLSPASDGIDSVVFDGISTGTKTITEGALSGYVLTDLGCSDQAPGTYDPATTSTVSTTIPLGGTVTCTFINEEVVGQTTRTQGFWSTHLSLAWAVWNGGTVGGHTYDGVSDNMLCGRAIDTQGELMGAFWSNISQTYSPKGKRSSLDQARMRLLQQLIAAELNHEAFGSSPSGEWTIEEAEAAFCSDIIADINAAASAMAAFNESGDSEEFTPGVSANGKTAKNAADLHFWDILPAG